MKRYATDYSEHNSSSNPRSWIRLGSVEANARMALHGVAGFGYNVPRSPLPGLYDMTSSPFGSLRRVFMLESMVLRGNQWRRLSDYCNVSYRVQAYCGV